jgi:excisionase family DNA binding protein
MENPFEKILEQLKKLDNRLDILSQQVISRNDEDSNDLLGVREIARELGLAESTIYRKVREQTIPFTKYGGRLYFNLNRVKDMIHGKNS